MPTLLIVLPRAANTVRTWVMDVYKVKREEIKQDLHINRFSQIYLSFDLWTSPNSVILMAVVAHYVNKKFRNTSRLIALRNFNGSHSGANMAELLIKIIKKFDIQNLLGYFVTDNADNNDIYINAVFRTLMSDLSAKERSRRRLRY